MARLLQPINDILSRLSTIYVVNAEGSSVPLFSDIWNNQIEMLIDGRLQNFPRPAAFVETLVQSVDVQNQGIRMMNLVFRIHLVNEFYNADGTFARNTAIFDLRDKVLTTSLSPTITGLSTYCPTGCSPLVCTNEQQDYTHASIYHYVLDFSTKFTDSTSSPYDANAGVYTEDIVDDLDMSVVVGGVPSAVVDANPTFILPTKKY